MDRMPYKMDMRVNVCGVDVPLGFLERLRDLRFIRRLHARRMVFPQSVAEHTLGVISEYLRFCATSNVEPDLNAILYIVFHDLPEVETGDVPYYTERAIQISALPEKARLLKEMVSSMKDVLNPLQRVMVDLADMRDLVHTLEEEPILAEDVADVRNQARLEANRLLFALQEEMKKSESG